MLQDFDIKEGPALIAQVKMPIFLRSMSKESHVDPELTVRKCPICTNQIRPDRYAEHVTKCDGKYSDFGGRMPKPNAGGATG